jgi:hypothetical protein
LARLDRHITAKKVKGYYESVFAELVAEGDLTFAPVFFEADRWYEIDDLVDLSAAEKIFPGPTPFKVASLPARNMAGIKNAVVGVKPAGPLSSLVMSD